MTYNVFGGTLDLAQPTNPFDHKRKIGLQRGGASGKLSGDVFLFIEPPLQPRLTALFGMLVTTWHLMAIFCV